MKLNIDVLGPNGSGMETLAGRLLPNPQGVDDMVDRDGVRLYEQAIGTDNHFFLIATPALRKTAEQLNAKNHQYTRALGAIYCVNATNITDENLQDLLAQKALYGAANQSFYVAITSIEGHDENVGNLNAFCQHHGIPCYSIAVDGENNQGLDDLRELIRNNVTAFTQNFEVQLTQCLERHFSAAGDATADEANANPFHQALNQLKDELVAAKLTAAQQQALYVALSTFLHEMADVDVDHDGKAAALRTFQNDCQSVLNPHPTLKKVAYALAAVAVAAATLILAVAAGFTVGLVMGLWTGPGAFVSAVAGAVAGAAWAAANTAAVATVATAAVLAVGAGVGSGFAFFKPTPVEKAINDFVNDDRVTMAMA